MSETQNYVIEFIKDKTGKTVSKNALFTYYALRKTLYFKQC